MAGEVGSASKSEAAKRTEVARACERVEQESCQRCEALRAEIEPVYLLYGQLRDQGAIDDFKSFSPDIQQSLKNQACEYLARFVEQGKGDGQILTLMVEKILPRLKTAVRVAQLEQANAQKRQLKAEQARTDAKLAEEEQRENTRHVVLTSESARQVASYQDFFQTVGAQSLPEYRKILAREKDNLLPEIHQAILSKIQAAEAHVNSLQTLFRPEEQSLFQSLQAAAKIDLSASTNAGIYVNIFQRIDAGVADAERREELTTQVAEKLGVEIKGRPHNVNALIRQVEQVEEAGGLLIDELGETRPLSIGNPISINSHLSFYSENQTGIGNYVVDAELGAGRHLKIEVPDLGVMKGGNQDRFMRMINALQTTYAFEQLGFSGLVNRMKDTGTEIGGTVDYDYLTKAFGDHVVAERLSNLVLGGSNGFSRSRFTTSAEINLMLRRLQAIHKEGDARTGNVDSESGIESLEQLGALRKGEVDWEQLGDIFSYIRHAPVLPAFKTLERKYGSGSKRNQAA